jgi:hypothetical protein
MSTATPPIDDRCAFCGSSDACYEKLDRKGGTYRAACWACVAPKKPAPIPEPDLTFLDDDTPPTPVSLITPTTAKPQSNLF